MVMVHIYVGDELENHELSTAVQRVVQLEIMVQGNLTDTIIIRVTERMGKIRINQIRSR